MELGQSIMPKLGSFFKACLKFSSSTPKRRFWAANSLKMIAVALPRLKSWAKQAPALFTYHQRKNQLF
jgi:hypothetical protein